jgi:hypothetical protein
MNNYFKIQFRVIKLIVIIVISVTSFSCQKYLDVNKDPNNPQNADSKELLPNSMITLATSFGYQYDFVSSMWAQYWTSGTTIGTTPIEYFTLVGGDINRSMGPIYNRTLMDLKTIIDRNESKNYVAIAKILTAYCYQVLVDLHSDVPYSESLRISDGILAPKYDDDISVYNQLIPLIDEAISDINNATDRDILPSSNDIIFNGNMKKWITFANTLKLRILVRQCQFDNTMLEKAFTLINSGVKFIDETNAAKIYFSGNTNGMSNPLWAQFESRPATQMYMRASQTSIDYLDYLSDPRIASFYKSGTLGYVGIEQGEASGPDYKGTANSGYAEPNTTYIYNKSLPYWLISPWESTFLQAEVAIRKSQSNDSTLWAQGIKESFLYLGLTVADVTDYIDNLPSDEYFGSDKIRSLAIQKWISMNGLQMTEGWIETKRFDLESTNSVIFRGDDGFFHSPVNNSLGLNKFPSCFVYSSNEIATNPNVPKRVVTDKVFWDN